VSRFENYLSEIINDFRKNSYSIIDFYTIDKVIWENLRIRATHQIEDVKVCLNCIDESILTITALRFAEHGEHFNVYLDDTNTILEMLANDFYIDYEIKRTIYFINEKLNIFNHIDLSLVECYDGLASKFRNLKKKTSSWRKIKLAIKELITSKPFISKLGLYQNTLRKIVEGRLAFFNGPKQIFINDEYDEEEKVQHFRLGFYEANLVESKISNTLEIVREPYYKKRFDELSILINRCKNDSERLLNEARDLLTAFQTEFSAYAVWIALIALIISLILGVVTLNASTI
jgi:hypothetical protein